MNELPLVSVVLPTHNRAPLLGRAVSGVLSQTYSHLELIVVDDGSSDETLQILQSVSDPRLRIVQHDDAKGAAAARNTGICCARGDFIAFQDSDDEWFEEKIERQMEVFQRAETSVGVVSCGFWVQEGMRRTYFPYKRFRIREGDIHNALLWENFLDTPSLLVKKRCLEKVGLFDERLPRFQDWELCIRLSQICFFAFVDSPLYVSHRQLSSISTNSLAGLKALQIIFENNQETICADNKMHSHYLQWLGMLCMENNKVLEARRNFRKAIALCPSTLKYHSAYLLSWFGSAFFDRLIKMYMKTKNR